MRRASHIARIGALLCGLLACILSLGLMGLAASDRPAGAHLAAARARWEARAFESYHIAVRIEALGRVCTQRLEVHGGWVRRMIENTCDGIWIEPLTVEELFELSSEIERIPPSRCVPSAQHCPCHRVFTLRHIEYDDQLGFPGTLIARSEVQFRPAGADFWRHLIEQGALPACRPMPRRFTIQVLSLTALT